MMENQHMTQSIDSSKSTVKRETAKPKTTTKSRTPVVTFNSKSRELRLYRTANIEGEVFRGNESTLDLSGIPEIYKQLIISAVKLTLSYSLGNDITKQHVSSKKDEQGVPLKSKSMVDEFHSIKERLTTKPESIPAAVEIVSIVSETSSSFLHLEG